MNNPNKTAAEAQAQNAEGAAAATEENDKLPALPISEDGNELLSSPEAPIFVGSVREFFKGPHFFLNGFGSLPIRGMHRGFLLWGLGVVVLYMAFFVFAERWTPQLYQSWLDFCLPLTEYVGGLTPRAGRIMTQLTENGYPERADDALHGIAMARVLVVPILIVMLIKAVSAAHPSTVFISCTRWTHIKIWLRIFFGLMLACALAGLFIWGLEVFGGERFGEEFDNEGFWARNGQYHIGNAAMYGDLMGCILISMIFWACVLAIPGMSPFRFIIVQHPPEDKA